MLKAIIGQMGRHSDRLNDTERGLIDAAVNAEWEKNGAEGSIDGVIEALIARQHIQGEELAIAMRPFSSAGTYGRFFTGQSTLKISADPTVFELPEDRQSVDPGKGESVRVDIRGRRSIQKKKQQ